MLSKTDVFSVVFLLLSAIPYAAYANADERMTIYAVNYPLQYFAQRIAAERAEVVFPVPRDIDPAFWNPDAKTIYDYQRAELILLNGANYAKWVNKASLSRSRLVNTSKAFAENYIQSQSGAAHSHGTGPEHAHAGTAFTTWLDLQQAVLQAKSIKQAMIKIRPQFKAEFETRFASLENDLLTLDTELKTLLAANQNQALLASHPVYQYMARRYGIDLYSVMWEPDAFPEPTQWRQVEDLARIPAAKWLLWEGRPEAASAAQLKQMGIGSIVFEPCANAPAQGDFLSVMKKNLNALKRAF